MSVSVAPSLAAAATTVKIKGKTAGRVTASVSKVGRRDRVFLQRYSGGRWVTVTSSVPTSTGGVVFTLPRAQGRSTSYRVIQAATTAHAAGKSKTIQLSFT